MKEWLKTWGVLCVLMAGVAAAALLRSRFASGPAERSWSETALFCGVLVVGTAAYLSWALLFIDSWSALGRAGWVGWWSEVCGRPIRVLACNLFPAAVLAVWPRRWIAAMALLPVVLLAWECLLAACGGRRSGIPVRQAENVRPKKGGKSRKKRKLRRK